MATPSSGARRDARSAPPPRRLAGLTVAAESADVSVRTMRRWIAEGRLTGYRIGPRLIKVDLAELDALARPIPAAGGGA